MGEVLHFPDRKALRIMELSNRFDAVIEGAMIDEVPPWELSGVLAHTLGRLLRAVADPRQVDFCLDIIADVLDSAQGEPGA